jgi:hypothetical protein
MICKNRKLEPDKSSHDLPKFKSVVKTKFTEITWLIITVEAKILTKD